MNRAEQARYLAAAQELHSAGLDVDVPEEWPQDPHFLDVAVAGGPATGAFDLPNGGVGYAICVRLVPVQHELIVPHCQITTKWDAQIALLNFDERSPICNLGWLIYSRNEVLNQGFDNSLRFHYRGQVIEGTILAWAFSRFPQRIALERAYPSGSRSQIHSAKKLRWRRNSMSNGSRRGKMRPCAEGAGCMSHWQFQDAAGPERVLPAMPGRPDGLSHGL